jgi:hypothetical protein
MLALKLIELNEDAMMIRSQKGKNGTMQGIQEGPGGVHGCTAGCGR